MESEGERLPYGVGLGAGSGDAEDRGFTQRRMSLTEALDQSRGILLHGQATDVEHHRIDPRSQSRLATPLRAKRGIESPGVHRTAPDHRMRNPHPLQLVPGCRAGRLRRQCRAMKPTQISANGLGRMFAEVVRRVAREIGMEGRHEREIVSQRKGAAEEADRTLGRDVNQVRHEARRPATNASPQGQDSRTAG